MTSAVGGNEQTSLANAEGFLWVSGALLRFGRVARQLHPNQ
jgi:hypothetical protein